MKWQVSLKETLTSIKGLRNSLYLTAWLWSKGLFYLNLLSGQGTQIHSNLTFWGGSMFDVDVNDKYCYLIENYFAKIQVLWIWKGQKRTHFSHDDLHSHIALLVEMSNLVALQSPSMPRQLVLAWYQLFLNLFFIVAKEWAPNHFHFYKSEQIPIAN